MVIKFTTLKRQKPLTLELNLLAISTDFVFQFLMFFLRAVNFQIGYLNANVYGALVILLQSCLINFTRYFGNIIFEKFPIIVRHIGNQFMLISIIFKQFSM